MAELENIKSIQIESTDTEFKKDSHSRSIIKAVSWRIVGTIDTMIWAWVITRKINISIMIGSTEAVSKIILFYFHERAWAKIPVGGVTGLIRSLTSKKE